MTKPEAIKLIAVLRAAYPNQDITEETVELYAAMLADLDFSIAQESLQRHIATSRFFPTVAELRDAPRVPVDDGGFITREKARRYGWIADEPDMPELDAQMRLLRTTRDLARKRGRV